MVLVIDVGNTNITLGLYKKEGLYLKKSWRIATDRQKTSDEFGIGGATDHVFSGSHDHQVF